MKPRVTAAPRQEDAVTLVAQFRKTLLFKLPAAGVALAILCGALAAACSPPDCGCDEPLLDDGGEWAR
jgi:hypothetical protein